MRKIVAFGICDGYLRGPGSSFGDVPVLCKIALRPVAILYETSYLQTFFGFVLYILCRYIFIQNNHNICM